MPGQHVLTDTMTGPTFLVHIGKCGGSSLRRALLAQDEKPDLRIIHIRKPPIKPKGRYYIVVRNPLSRALSAFNWRHKLVVETEEQKDRFEGEWQVLQKYGNLNALANALYTEDGADNKRAQADFRKVHHLQEDIAFYLSELLEGITPAQVEGVFSQETLDADIEQAFGLKSEFREKRNPVMRRPCEESAGR